MATHLKIIPDERLQGALVDTVKLVFRITAAKTISQPSGIAAPVIAGFDAADFVQASVDALSSSAASGITVATSFGSTAMGTDMFGFVLAHGSAKRVHYVIATVYQSAGGTPVNTYKIFNGAGASTTALANTLTDGCAVSTEGMIYGRFVSANIDSVTTGGIEIEIGFSQA